MIGPPFRLNVINAFISCSMGLLPLYIQLVRRRSRRNQDGSLSLDLQMLNRDLVLNFILGKPQIAEPIPLLEFVFKKSRKFMSPTE